MGKLHDCGTEEGLFPKIARRWKRLQGLDDLDAVVREGDPELPLSQQGIKILGVPAGRKEFVIHELELQATCHTELLKKTPSVKDLQCARPILLYCGVSTASFHVRAVSPEVSLQFAQRHEAQIWRCLTRLLGVAPEAISESAWAAATLPLSSGGWRCRSSVRLRHPARWASSADSNKMIGERHPEVAGTIFLRSSRLFTLALLTWQKQVSAPNWVLLASGDVDAPNVVVMKEPNQPKKGWQATVSRVVDAQMFFSPPCPRGTPRC